MLDLVDTGAKDSWLGGTLSLFYVSIVPGSCFVADCAGEGGVIGNPTLPPSPSFPPHISCISSGSFLS